MKNIFWGAASIAQWIRLWLPIATPSSNPKHAIYALSICMWIVYYEKGENEQKKRPRLVHIFKYSFLECSNNNSLSH